MTGKSIAVIVCCLLGLAAVGCRKNTAKPARKPPTQVTSSKDVVELADSEITVPASGASVAVVKLAISPGYHINANPATFSYLIPTAVNPGKAEGISAGKPIYPAAQKKKFQFAEEPLAVYEGEVQIRLPLRVEANAGKGAPSLPIDVRVQACDSEKCYAPDTLKTTITVNVK